MRSLTPAILFLFLAIAGCQRYVPAPLDLSADYADLLAHDPASRGVAEYARRLAEHPRSGAPARYDPSDGLSVDEAEVVALFFNPALRAARLKAAVPFAGAAEAGRWQDPELAIDAEHIISGADDPWVIGGMLNLTLPLSGRLPLEKDKALAEADVEKLRALSEERKLIADLRARWLEWSAAVQRAQLIRRHLQALESAMETAERLRQAGEVSSLDARIIRIERARNATKLQSIEARVRVDELSLKSLMGLAPSASVNLLPSLALAEPSDSPDWPDLLERHPQTRIAAAQYELAERTLKLEIQKQRPDVRIGGGAGTDEGETRALFGIAIPLPIFNANRRAIAQANADREAARATARAVYEDLVAQAAQAQARVQAARAHVDFVEKELAPLADQQVEEARRLGRLGDAATLVLVEALKSAHEASVEALDAQLELSLARARLISLTEDVAPDRPQPQENRP
jgi:outer membrane protein TolC